MCSSLIGRRVVGIAIALLSLSAGCERQRADTPSQPIAHASADVQAADPKNEAGAGSTISDHDATTPSAEQSHEVVFADRVRYAYAVLVPANTKPNPNAGLDAEPNAPTPAELRAIVERAFAGRLDEPDVASLLVLIDRDPESNEAGRLMGDEAQRRAVMARPDADLLGLVTAVVPRADIVDDVTLADPTLSRGASPSDRELAGAATHAVLLRAEYRPRQFVRGLRLLQSLVLAYAREVGGVVFDVDTYELWSVDAFATRRLRVREQNVADQIAVVPFPDPAHGEGHVRLCTRGMRRFGAPELELDGLVLDRVLLTRGTDLLRGLALTVARLAELDEAGYATQAPEVIRVTREDVATALGHAHAELPACVTCSDGLDVRLVERAAVETDPPNHVVARVVAPRSDDKSATTQHVTWVRAAIERLLGGA